MYIPSVGDKQEDPGVIITKAAELLDILKVIGDGSAGGHSLRWRRRKRSSQAPGRAAAAVLARVAPPA